MLHALPEIGPEKRHLKEEQDPDDAQAPTPNTLCGQGP
jgi:hypothetical protein